MTVAITRGVSAAFEHCALTHVERVAIDVDAARVQHAAYEAALAALGCEVRRIAADPDLPDCVFVEDAAVVLDEVALIARPGAPSRRAETPAVAAALEALRPLEHVAAPATLEGGDVLRIGRSIRVGLTSRTNAEGAARVREIAAPRGYEVRAIPIAACLHLKSAVTQVAPDAVLLNPRWIDAREFSGLEVIEVDPDEPHAANALLVGESVVLPASCARTRARLEARGIRVVAVDVSEVQKAEGGVTCCSVLIED